MNKIKLVSIVLSLIGFLILCIIGLADALIPLFLSFGLAYMLFPVIKKLEHKGCKRVYAVTGVLISTVLVLMLISLLVIPNLIIDGKHFFNELPHTSIRAVEKVEFMAKEFGYELDLSKQGIKSLINDHISSLSTGVLKSFSVAVKGVFSSIVGWILAILNILLVPLFFFYVINDYEKICYEIQSFVPKSILPKIEQYSIKCNTVLSGYIRGQILVALILSLLYAVGFSIIGLKFGLLIGLLTGLISIIPYAGFLLGFIAAMSVSLANYNGVGAIIGVVCVFVVIQMTEGFLITPKLVGKKVGLSSFATILALIIGGNLLGMFGMLLAIPLAAIAKSIIAELRLEYHSTKIYE